MLVTVRAMNHVEQILRATKSWLASLPHCRLAKILAVQWVAESSHHRNLEVTVAWGASDFGVKGDALEAWIQPYQFSLKVARSEIAIKS